MKRLLIILLVLSCFTAKVGCAMVVTDTPAEKTSWIKTTGQKVKDIKTSVEQSTVVTKTAAAIGSAKKTISTYMTAVQTEIKKAKEKYDKYKKKVDKYKKEIEAAKAEYEATKAKINEVKAKVDEAKNKYNEIKNTAKNISETVKNADSIAAGLIESKTGVSLRGSEDSGSERQLAEDNFSGNATQSFDSDISKKTSTTANGPSSRISGGSKLVDIVSSSPTRKSIGGGETYSGKATIEGAVSRQDGGLSDLGQSNGIQTGISAENKAPIQEAFVENVNITEDQNKEAKEEASLKTAATSSKNTLNAALSSPSEVTKAEKSSDKVGDSLQEASVEKSADLSAQPAVENVKKDPSKTIQNDASSAIKAEKKAIEEESGTTRGVVSIENEAILQNSSISQPSQSAASTAENVSSSANTNTKKSLNPSKNEETSHINQSSGSAQKSSFSNENVLGSVLTERQTSDKDVSTSSAERSSDTAPVFSTRTKDDFGYRFKGEISEEKNLPKTGVTEGDIYKLKNGEGSYVLIKDSKQDKLEWINLPKEIEINSEITEEKSIDITNAINKELLKQNEEKKNIEQNQKNSEIEGKPSRAAFKISAGYGHGHMSQSFSLAFASSLSGETGETEDVYIISNRLSRMKFFFKECDLDYKKAAEEGKLVACYQKLNDVMNATNEEAEEISSVSGNDIRTLAAQTMTDAYMEDIAAQYLEALEIYNDSLEFGSNEISPIVTSQVGTSIDAMEQAKELNLKLGESLNKLSQLHARTLSNQVKQMYLRYKIGSGKDKTEQ